MNSYQFGFLFRKDMRSSGNIIKTTIRILILVSLLLGFHKVCCLSVMDSFEDYAKYRKLSPEELRFTINKDDLSLISDIRKRVDPREGVLVLHHEEYFISYYVYPVKMYKFKKGYFKTTKNYDIGDVDKTWLAERNIKWALLEGPDGLYLKKISEAW